MCRNCGARAPAWEGRCRGCGEWGSLDASAPPPPSTGVPSVDFPSPGVSSAKLIPLSEIDGASFERTPSGIGELDRVLGGGWVPGSAILVGGDPGVGKSTMLLAVAARAAQRGLETVYVSGEESAAQLKLRAERLGFARAPLHVLAHTELDAILHRLDEVHPSVVVVDSIQMLRLVDLSSSSGSVAQVRECGASLVQFAKRSGAAVFLIGHVTKEGAIAGPRVLEHIVDTVLTFEGDLEGEYRILRATKNRFGPVREIGVFTMESDGLREVPNPSDRFCRLSAVPAPGSAAFPSLQGSRVLLVEIQSIVSPSSLSAPVRRVAGIDANRLPLLLAVLERRAETQLVRRDVFVNVVGGMEAAEPAADLAICLAVMSSLLDRPLPPGTAAAGEVGLCGEVRAVPRPELRVQEVSRLGLRRLLVPAASVPRIPGGGSLEVVPVASIQEAVATVFGPAATAPSTSMG